MFCTSNTNKDFNANENIIDANNHLDKGDLVQNKNFTD